MRGLFDSGSGGINAHNSPNCGFSGEITISLIDLGGPGEFRQCTLAEPAKKVAKNFRIIHLDNSSNFILALA